MACSTTNALHFAAEAANIQTLLYIQWPMSLGMFEMFF
jgi:hypothetical protein